MRDLFDGCVFVQGRCAGAESMLARVLAIKESKDANSEEVAAALSNLGDVLRKQVRPRTPYVEQVLRSQAARELAHLRAVLRPSRVQMKHMAFGSEWDNAPARDGLRHSTRRFCAPTRRKREHWALI